MTVNKPKTVTREQVRKQRPTDEATVAGLRTVILTPGTWNGPTPRAMRIAWHAKASATLGCSPP